VLLIALTIVVTVFGFVPTGLIAFALAAWAFCAPQRDSGRRRLRRHALCWCWVSVAIGALVEAPVVAAIAFG
jgi:hypothetical protein